jgi:hypothetical protein
MTILTDEQLWEEEHGRDFAKHIWRVTPNEGVVLWIDYADCLEPVCSNAFWLTARDEQRQMMPTERDAWCEAAMWLMERSEDFKRDIAQCCAGHRARRSIERSRGAA